MYTLLVVLALTSIGTAQNYYHAPIPVAYQSHLQIPVSQPLSIAHKDVVENALKESQLPPEYTNKFYKNPRIASALAKESWFTSQEMPVYDREAEKIPRENIFKIFKNAGWIKRK